MSGKLSRIISLITMTALLLSMMCTGALSAAAATRGDVNGDGIVNMMDVMSLYNHASGKATLPESALAGGEVTGDGIVNMMDVMLLYRVVSGAATLPEPEPEKDPEPDEIIDPEPVGLTPLDPQLYYGRSLLAKESQDMVDAYDYIAEQVLLLNTDIQLWEYGLTLPEFERVFRYYRDDHPETFWVSGGYGYMYYTQNNVKYIYSMQQNYPYTKAQIDNFTSRLQAVAEKCVEGLTDATPQADRVKQVHDYLVLNAHYDTTYKAAYTHDARGVMLNGTGVCESYARAFQYLMYRCGIQCIVTFGTASSGESHMWNVLQIGGDWYQMDVTWNDPVFETAMETYIGYKYYNVTTRVILADRTMEYEYSNFNSSYQVSYPIPNCTATAENYELKEAVSLTSFNVSTMAPIVAQSILDDTQAIFKPTGSYTMSAFQTDFENPTKHWALINAVNAILPADKQLTRPGYSITPNPTNGLWSVYLRNMPV